MRVNDLTDTSYWAPKGLVRTKCRPDPLLSIEDFELEPLLSKILSHAHSVLEIGCGSSYWLPYFEKALRLEAAGIDFSPIQCDISRRLLAGEGATATVKCRDFRDPPQEWIGHFDAVFSAGVVEHFNDTSGTLKAFARYIRPGGLMITTVPNLSGIWGSLTSAICHSVLKVHNVFPLSALIAAHREANLRIVEARYIRWLATSILNTRTFSPAGFLNYIAYKLARTLRRAMPQLCNLQSQHLSAGQLIIAEVPK